MIKMFIESFDTNIYGNKLLLKCVHNKTLRANEYFAVFSHECNPQVAIRKKCYYIIETFNSFVKVRLLY